MVISNLLGIVLGCIILFYIVLILTTVDGKRKEKLCYDCHKRFSRTFALHGLCKNCKEQRKIEKILRDKEKQDKIKELKEKRNAKVN